MSGHGLSLSVAVVVVVLVLVAACCLPSSVAGATQDCTVKDPFTADASFDLKPLNEKNDYEVACTYFGQAATLIFNVCGPVTHDGCPKDSGACLSVNGTHLSLGALRYQPNYLLDSETMELIYPEGYVYENTDYGSAFLETHIEFFCHQVTNVTFVRQSSYVFYIDFQTPIICQASGLPLWARILMTVMLVAFSALFSGLTLGLLSLDLIQLEILMATGSTKEKLYAKKIYTVRKQGNLLLCTLLLGNTICNSSISILTADLTSGTVGLVVSAAAILILAEIVPQSICHKYGLAIGASTVLIVWVFIGLSFIITYPISRILDWALGEELGQTYNRAGLRSFLDVEHQIGEITADENRILAGALDFATRHVQEIMTPLDRVFMLEANDVLNLRNIQLIQDRGFSRIPVYDKKRENVIGVVLIKDLSFINPEDGILIRTAMEYYGRKLTGVFGDSRLVELLDQFRTGHSHMAVVWRDQHAEDAPLASSSMHDVIGIVTLEDVLETLIQIEISDETDTYTVTEPPRANLGLVSWQRRLAHRSEHRQLTDSQQDAVQSFLLNHIPEVFGASIMSSETLRHLIRSATVEVVETANHSTETQLYKAGVNYDTFTLILQGKVRILSGTERFESELGPFQYIAVKSLIEDPYTADFSAYATDKTHLLKITRNLYDRAIQASRIFRPTERPDQDSRSVLEMESADDDAYLLENV